MRSDDSLALVLRRRTPAPGRRHEAEPFEYRFSPNPVTVPLARHLFGDWLEVAHVEVSEREDVLVARAEHEAERKHQRTGV